MRWSWLLLVIIMVQTGCVPVTEPLSAPNKSTVDKRLLGKWKDAPGITEIDCPRVKGNPMGLMRAVLDGKENKPENVFWFITTKIGKDDYATIYLGLDDFLKAPDFRKVGEFAKWNKSKSRRYFIFKYRLDGTKLIVDGGNSMTAEKAMQGAMIMKRPSGPGFFKTPPRWLATYLVKQGPQDIFDGTNMRTLQRKSTKTP